MIDQNKIIEKLGFKAFNPMQQKTLKMAKTNDNIVLLSPTGSGKTVAFCLALLEKLSPQTKGLQAVILAPSRELVIQIESVFKAMGTTYKINACYGGHSLDTEYKNFSSAPAVLVGTPGRMAFHVEQESLDFSNVHSYVIDEFDKALELGFNEQMQHIITACKQVSFRLLTSATPLDNIPKFTGIKAVEILDFVSDAQIAPKISIEKVIHAKDEKLTQLIQLIGKIGKDAMIIFCNHRDAVERISETLTSKNVANSIFHGGLEQPDRERALLKFTNKSSSILICTDLAARGLDIPEIDHVIHYQVPSTLEAYTHRNGRTARMKAKGQVYVMMTSEEAKDHAFIANDTPTTSFKGKYIIDNSTDFTTIYISAGKKDKVNKGDILGYLIKTCGLTNEDIGVITVKDKQSFVAIKTPKVKKLLRSVENTKLKNKKMKIEVAND